MKGICFIPPLHNATVQGWKTETRRIMNPQPCDGQGYQGMQLCSDDGRYYAIFRGGEPFKPRHQPGETLYLKEPYCLEYEEDPGHIIYKYSGRAAFNNLKIKWSSDFSELKWENKLFMPQKYAQHFITIESVHCEQLQEINDASCEREGIVAVWENSFIIGWRNKYDGKTYDTRKQAYAALFDKINGKGTWESNPYVWVYDFELIKQTK